MNEVTLDLILNDMDHTLIPFIISSPFPMPMFVRQTETLPMMLGQAQTPGVHTTDASAVLKEHRKRGSEKNRTPCGGCSARKIRVRILQTREGNDILTVNCSAYESAVQINLSFARPARRGE